MRSLFTKAWRLARKGAKRYGGSARSYFAAALRFVWKGRRNVTRFELLAPCRRVLRVACVRVERLVHWSRVAAARIKV